MIAAAVHGAALEAIAPPNPKSIGIQAVFHSEDGQAVSHGSQAIRLFDPQFFGSPDEGFAFGTGSGDEEHRKLVYGQWYEALRNLDTFQAAFADLQIGDGLAIHPISR